MKVRIGPHTYLVQWDRDLYNKGSVAGICMEDEERIYIAENLGPGVERETLLHELLHAVWHQTTLDNLYDDKMEEQVVWSIAPGLLQLLRDNKHLVKFLLREE